MHASDLSSRVAVLEARIAELVGERARDGQVLERVRRALDFDAGTGARSRLYLEGRLLLGLQQARRDGHRGSDGERERGRDGVLTLGLLAVDGFAELRDGFGAQVGEAALAEVVAICRGVLRRQTDVVARYGGDAFALLFPQTRLDSAVGLAERMRCEVALTSVGSAALGVSIGLAAFPSGAQTAGALLAAAERALGRAKQSGNRVACSE